MPVGGTPIGAALGPDVGPRLGTLLGTDVGATLGGVLGGDVGPAVGTALGAEACATVADADGAARYVNVEVGAELAHAVNIRTEAARRATLRRSRASWTMETSPSRVDDGTSRRPDCLMGGIAFDHGLEGARASSAESPRPCTTGRRPRANMPESVNPFRSPLDGLRGCARDRRGGPCPWSPRGGVRSRVTPRRPANNLSPSPEAQNAATDTCEGSPQRRTANSDRAE